MLTTSRLRLARAFAGVIFAMSFTFSPRSFAGDAAVDALIHTGVDRYKRHDYEGARAIFLRAYEVDPSLVGTLFNLALAEIQSGHPVEAARHLRSYVASPQAQSERIESARSKWLPEAEAQIGRLSIEAPAGTEVSVDGAAVGTAPFGDLVYIAAGDHNLTAKIGSAERSMRVSAVAGKIIAVQFVADDAQPPPMAANVPPAPAASSSGPAAAEEPTASPRSGTSLAKTVTVATMGSVAVLATGFGVAFAVETYHDVNRANTLRAGLSSNSCAPGQPSVPAACPQLASANSDQHRDYDLARDLYIVGGVATAATVATWLLWPRSTSPSAWSIRPAFDARSASAQLSGAF
jgi:hypothetical protein